jgi:hypothetical protein
MDITGTAVVTMASGNNKKCIWQAILTVACDFATPTSSNEKTAYSIAS